MEKMLPVNLEHTSYRLLYSRHKAKLLVKRKKRSPRSESAPRQPPSRDQPAFYSGHLGGKYAALFWRKILASKWYRPTPT